MKKDFIEELNEAQKEAVLCIDGPSLIIAGAGSGKTKVLTYRIANLLNQGIYANNILALTFTNKAAREMKERIYKIVGKDIAQNLWMGTFHSIFSKILRCEAEKLGYTSNYTIYDTDDSKSLIRSIIRELELDKDVYKPNEIQKRISTAKNNLVTAKKYASTPVFFERDKKARKPLISEIFIQYEQKCKSANAMDFDDLLVNTNILFHNHADILLKYQKFFKYILVDEYQDTNFAQYLILQKLATLNKNIGVVGDDSQSIYSFRGARIENILNFKNDYPDYSLFKLEQNYRSTKTILNAANSIIEKNEEQIQKKIWSDNEVGDKVKIAKAATDGEEGYIIANTIIDNNQDNNYKYSDFAILYRTNAQSRVFEEALRKRNIPYKIYGGLSFYRRKEIKDLLGYLRLIINNNDNEAFIRIINYPVRGIGKTTLDKIINTANENNTSFWSVVLNIENNTIGLKSNAVEKLIKFKNFIIDLIQKSITINAYDMTLFVAKSTGILQSYYNEKTPESLSKYENIQELLNSIKDFCDNKLEEEGIALATIDLYLENVALITDQDTDKPEDKNKVSLMTIHAAKGLEFKHVNVVGLEENLFPSPMSLFSKSDIEEERRLFYVAITRAEKKLMISYSNSRYKWGELNFVKPSRFLKEIDELYVELPDEIQDIKNDSTYKPTNAIHGKTTFTKKSRLINKQKIPLSNSMEESFVPDNLNEIQVGMQVEHQKFGFGKIINIEGSFPNTKATVFFKNIGQKKLLLKFAKLKIIR